MNNQNLNEYIKLVGFSLEANGNTLTIQNPWSEKAKDYQTLLFTVSIILKVLFKNNQYKYGRYKFK